MQPRGEPSYLQSGTAGHITRPLLDLREPSLDSFCESWSPPDLLSTTHRSETKAEKQTADMSVFTQIKTHGEPYLRSSVIPYLLKAQQRDAETAAWYLHKCRQSAPETSTLVTGAESNPSSISHTWVNLIGTVYCYHFLCFIHCTRAANN